MTRGKRRRTARRLFGAGLAGGGGAFTPAALAGLSAWLTPTAAALPAANPDGLTQLAWDASLPVIRPFPLLPSMTEVRVYAPSGTSPVAGNVGTAGRYNWHTRVYHGSGSKVWVMGSRGLTNEDAPGQWSYCHLSADDGATWGSGIELIPNQDTVASPSGSGRVTWPSGWYPNPANSDLPYAVIAIEDDFANYAGVALVARTVAADGTLGTLFRITSEDYTVAGGATKIAYDAVLGPPILAWWKINGHWGGNDVGNQSWTISYSNGGNTGNERAVTPLPSDPTHYLAVWKNKGGFTANRVPCGLLDSLGAVSTNPTATNIPTSPNAPAMGTTTDGRVYLIDSPTDTGAIVRDPLAISFTDPGNLTFTSTFAIRQDESIAPVYAGSFKGSASGYPHPTEANGYIFVSYGVHKEDLWVAKIPIPKQVATWADGGGGAALSAASVAARPTRQECQAVAKQLVYFDGVAQVLSRTANLPSGTGAGTCVIAFRPTRVLGTQYLVAVADTGSADNFWGIRLNATRLEIVSSAGATVNVVRGAYRFANNTSYVVTVESTGSAWTLRVNGASSALSVISGSNTGDWCGDVAGPDAYSVGALVASTTTGFYRGWIGDLALYAAAVTTTQRTSLETYATTGIGGLVATATYLDEQFTVPAATLAAIDSNAWAVVSGVGQVFHSQLKVTTATVVISTDVEAANYTLTVQLFAGADNCQVCVRYVDENNYYMVRNNAGTLQIYGRVSGTTTQRASVAGAGAQPCTLTVVLNGASIQATIGSTVASYGSVLDTTATKIALRGESNAVIFDSLRVAP